MECISYHKNTFYNFHNAQSGSSNPYGKGSGKSNKNDLDQDFYYSGPCAQFCHHDVSIPGRVSGNFCTLEYGVPSYRFTKLSLDSFAPSVCVANGIGGIFATGCDFG